MGARYAISLCMDFGLTFDTHHSYRAAAVQALTQLNMSAYTCQWIANFLTHARRAGTALRPG